MKSYTNLVAGLLVGVAMSVVPIHAGTLGGTFDGDATLTPNGTPGFYTQNFTGDGVDAAFGAFTVTATSMIDFSSAPDIMFTNGSIIETFSGSSGEFFGTSSGSGTGNGHGRSQFQRH